MPYSMNPYTSYREEQEKEKGMMYPDTAIPKSQTGPSEYQSFMNPSNYSLGEQPAAVKTQGFSESDIASVGTSAATGAAMGGPAGAAVAAGGTILTQYLANKAASERARRDRAAQIENQYAQNQNQGYQTFFNALQGAYR